jgi:hypothetical protein
MVWFYTRAGDTRTCETRLALDGQGYELVVTDGDGAHIETYDELADLLAREHQLLVAWRAQGWREASSQRDR